MKDMDYILPQKAELKKLKISDINFQKPDLKNIPTSKAIAVSQWLKDWIKSGLKDGSIQVDNLLPSKPDLAYFLGVSIGTVQNALRSIEDIGYVESKQCIGTMVRDYNNKDRNIRKLTSKREFAIEAIKKYIVDNKYKLYQILPSPRVLSDNIGCSLNTARLALEYMDSMGILKRKYKNTTESGWAVLKTDLEANCPDVIEHETLVTKIEKDLKDYITNNLKVGDKIPPHQELSEKLKASMKTIHDGLKILINEGILLPHRGRYGTSVVRQPYEKSVKVKKETSIFASAKETEFYYYQRTQSHVKKLIADKYHVGEKLPSIMALAKEFDLSPNTIRKAFHNLAKEGYLAFSRGRYGGTFVIDIPQAEEGSFKWLAVNPKYAEAYKK